MQSNGRFEDRRWLARVRAHNGTAAAVIGTAFAIDARHWLTCAHVVRDVSALPQQECYRARLLPHLKCYR